MKWARMVVFYPLCCSLPPSAACERMEVIVGATIFLVFLSLQSFVTATISNQQIAEELHAKGIENVKIGNYKQGLAHFRAACRRYNSSALFWNDLGVTEMRLGQFQRAKRRFAKALSIDQDFDTAGKNLKDLQAYLPVHAPQDDQNYDYKHKMKCPKIISSSKIVLEPPPMSNTNGFCNSIWCQPFVVNKAFKMFNITDIHVERVFNRNFLSESYGTQRVDFYPHNMNEEQAHPYFLSMEPALRQLLYGPEEVYIGVDASEPGTYIQWNLDAHMWHNLLVEELHGALPIFLNDRRWTDACFLDTESVADATSSAVSITSPGDAQLDPSKPPLGSDTFVPNTWVDVDSISHFFLATHWQMLLLGEKGAGMFNHQDTLRTASWQLQLVGSKKWHLCGPEQSPFLYKAGEVDMFNPDYVRFPLLRNATCYETIVHAGEMIYYPADFWHQTINLETPSIALSSTLVTQQNYRMVAEELRKECSGSGRIFVSQQRMCENLERCFSLWGQIYE